MNTNVNPLLFPMLSQFHLTPDDQAKMDNYFILHWSGAWFQKQHSEQSLFKRDGIYYVVLFDDLECKALARDTKDVALSFRFCKEVNNTHGYVICKKVK